MDLCQNLIDSQLDSRPDTLLATGRLECDMTMFQFKRASSACLDSRSRVRLDKTRQEVTLRPKDHHVW